LPFGLWPKGKRLTKRAKGENVHAFYFYLWKKLTKEGKGKTILKKRTCFNIKICLFHLDHPQI
jgi:hypothetical protein